MQAKLVTFCLSKSHPTWWPCHLTPVISSRLCVRPGQRLGQPSSPSSLVGYKYDACRHYHRSMCAARGPILLGHDVKQALANGCPVVALESTVITHGLPEPKNLELALALEREISSGRWWTDNYEQEPSAAATDEPEPSNPMFGQVTPATVGIVRGQLIVGLSRDEIHFLASKQLSRPIKASRRDLAVAQAYGLSAGTTVSATMALASSVQVSPGFCGRISVFATGGLGGVHLGGESSMDISADLYEMARSPICLVSSGFKSFLDARRSLELLETLGCTVASLPTHQGAYQASSMADSLKGTGCGGTGTATLEARRSHLFPGFFTTTNGQQVRSPWRCESVQEAAQILFHCLGSNWSDLAARERLLSTGRASSRQGKDGPENAQGRQLEQQDEPRYLLNSRAMLLACPIPIDFSLDASHSSASMMNEITSRIEAREDLNGNEKTPLILAELARATGGQTLEANLALLRNNARIGAHLAYEYSKLCSESSAAGAGGSPCPRGTPIVIGCTMIDMHVRTRIDDQFKLNPHYSGVTFHGKPHMTLGGVGRNLATALGLLGHQPTFITALANDNLAQFARNELNKFTRHNNPTTNDPGRIKILNWNEPGASSCFALVLIDSLTGQCEYVIADLDATRAISSDNLKRFSNNGRSFMQELDSCPLLIMDGNLPSATIELLIKLCYESQVPIFLEPTDVVCLSEVVAGLKTISQNYPEALNSLVFLSPNVVELYEITKQFDGNHVENVSSALGNSAILDDVQRTAQRLMQTHLTQLRCLLVTMDKRGVLIGVRASSIETGRPNDITLSDLGPSTGNESTVVFEHFVPETIIERPISASGAGDCFASGFISGMIDGLTLEASVQLGFKAAACALNDKSTVPITLSHLVSSSQG